VQLRVAVLRQLAAEGLAVSTVERRQGRVDLERGRVTVVHVGHQVRTSAEGQVLTDGNVVVGGEDAPPAVVSDDLAALHGSRSRLAVAVVVVVPRLLERSRVVPGEVEEEVVGLALVLVVVVPLVSERRRRGLSVRVGGSGVRLNGRRRQLDLLALAVHDHLAGRTGRLRGLTRRVTSGKAGGRTCRKGIRGSRGDHTEGQEGSGSGHGRKSGDVTHYENTSSCCYGVSDSGTESCGSRAPSRSNHLTWYRMAGIHKSVKQYPETFYYLAES
jgi:hypothetical protein